MKRFLDRKDLRELISQSSDFNKRRYGSFIRWISYGILLVAFAFALNVNKTLFEIYSGVDMVLASDVLLTIIFMALVGGVVIAYLLFVIFNLRHLLHALEFQSTMFSGAVRANTIFVLIANQSNSIIYADKDAMALFDEDYLDTIDEFLQHNIMSNDDKIKIKDAIASEKSHEFTAAYKDKNNKETSSIISINPIDKPKGYFSIRGFTKV